VLFENPQRGIESVKVAVDIGQDAVPHEERLPL